MATKRKTKTAEPKIEPPARNDKADMRCAFVESEPGSHYLGDDPGMMWCSGCGFYVCESCAKALSLMGPHDVCEHQISDDDEGSAD